MIIAIKLLFIALMFVTLPVFAHPGRTASDGCHYCRTNCDDWGEVYGARHCHGGGSLEIYSPPSPSFDYDYSPPPSYSPPLLDNYAPSPNNYDYSTSNTTETEEDGSWIWYVLGALGIGGIIHYFYKRSQ